MIVPWTVRRANQSILKEISLEYSLKGLILKLKLQYVGHLRQGIDSLEKTLVLRKIDGRKRRGALLSSRDTGLLEPSEWPKGSQASCGVWKEDS